MRILVIDGQGGKLGALLVAELKNRKPDAQVIAVGTNGIATSAMLKAGADAGATGENPVVVQAEKVDLILGPIGIVLADALLGEVSAGMAAAVARSSARKLLIPMNKCNTLVVGAQGLTVGDYVSRAMELI